ncbi:hypothetical protein K1T71_009114 [Dendrolimus kikuchii]|uniref:Uncharacterized protein n=1 Tax=Dendrolimus kikuchii TaxID=765133 RepID=A0ACC1CTT9_9NEOP|nr:hypothetical protein K1T71_009114 [Dendrolimus kikuchii]
MFKCLLEIAYEAEVDTNDNPELLEYAKETCNEIPATRSAKINELRQMIFDREECQPTRIDDEFLLRFLRSKNFVVPRAHRLLVRYCTFRQQYPYLYDGVDLWGLMKLKDIFEGTSFDRPDIGRLTVFRIGLWDPNEVGIQDLLRGAYAMSEIGLRQPKIQIIGGTIVVDFEGMTLKQASAITPSVAYQILCLIGLATPTRVHGCHLINYSWVLNTFWYVFKRFIPHETMHLIHFHGSDMKSLQKHIDLEALHPRYGGTCRTTITVGDWLQKLKKYRDEKFDRDMKQLGYIIKQ